MRELNLRSDFELFNWNKSAKRQRSYQALVNRELTSHFDRSVWSEIVSHLKSLQSEMGIPWDNTYGSGLNEWWIFTFADFTAKMFNAVTLNIGKDINTIFKWEYDESYEGYLGRKFVKGCGVLKSQEGDTVYGSYLIEIVKALNKYIRICKGEADFINANINASLFDTHFDVTLSNPIAAAMAKVEQAVASISATISEAELINFAAHGWNTAQINGTTTLKYASNLFRAKSISRTFADAEITLELLYRNMQAFILGSMTATPTLKISNKKSLLESTLLGRSGGTVEMSFPLLTEFITDLINQTHEACTLDNGSPITLGIDHTDRAGFDSLLELGSKLTLDASSVSTSHGIGELFMMEKSEIFVVLGAVLRIMGSRMTNTIARRMNSTQNPRANISKRSMVSLPAIVGELEALNSELSIIPPTLRVFIATYLECTVAHSMWQSSEMAKGKSTYFDSVIGSTQTDAADMIARGIAGLEAEEENVCRTYPELIALRLTELECSIANKAQTGAQLMRYRDASNISIDTLLESVSDACLEPLHYDETPSVDAQFAAIAEAVVSAIEPFGVFVNETISEVFGGIITLRDAEDTIECDVRALSEDIAAELVNICLVDFANEETSEATISADMSFDGASWNNPEFREDGLHIWQIYDTQQAADTLYLDKEDE